MADEKVEFRKVRDLGQNLNDTFVFIKQNLKPLLGAFFAICGVFMLGKAIFGGIYQSHSFGVFDRLRSGLGRRGQGNPFDSIFTPEYFLMLLFSWFAYIAMRVSLCAYIKFYVDNDGAQPTIQEVWVIFRKYFLKVFLYTIPLGLLIVAGCFLCLLPGIYLAIVLLPFDIILVMEDASFGDAFNKCFTIIKENFWMSFAVYFIAGLVYSFGGMIVSVVVGLVVGLITYFSTSSIGTTAGVVTSFLNIFTGVFYIIFLVSCAFQYFSLAELRDGTGILQRIDNIGGEKNKFDETPEEY